MKIIYLGSFFDEIIEKRIWNDSKGPMVLSANTFQQALKKGFDNNNYKIEYVTLPSIGSFPFRYKKLFFKGKSNSNVSSLSFLNISVIKNFSIYLSAKIKLSCYLKNYDKDIVIVVYSLIPCYLEAAISIKNKFPEKKIQICVIILDLPQFFDDNNMLVYRYLNKITIKKVNLAINNVDSFVLLTKYMVEALNINDKPWMLLEGIYSEEKITPVIKKDGKKIILYSGKLDKRFGIDSLLSAFSLINDTNYRLWICGEGLMKQDIIRASKHDSRIKYFGLINRDDVLLMQKKATLLINPRQPDGEYTRYSFPSKTMEYMASGTPTIMYNLEGIPDEYKKYIGIVPNTGVETLKNEILIWSEKSQEELDDFGRKARDFILKNKNANIQAELLYNFIINNITK